MEDRDKWRESKGTPCYQHKRLMICTSVFCEIFNKREVDKQSKVLLLKKKLEDK